MRRLVLLALLAGACTPGVATGPGGQPPGAGSGGRTGSGGSGGSTTSGAGGAMTEMPRPEGPPPVRCTESALAPRALVRLTEAELGNSLREVFPEAKAAFSLRLSDPLDSKEGFVNPSKLLLGEDSAEKVLSAAKAIADVVVGAGNAAALAGKFPCVTAGKNAACASEIIKRYGRRLFRRPLTTDEETRYRQLYDGVAAKSDFAQGVKWALVALMQSPHALYRRQIGQAMGQGTYQLGPYELASELAFTFTGTTPSEELLGKAERGQLGTREALMTEARALLDSPAGRRALGEFFRLWLGYDLVTANERGRIPAFAGLRDKLAEETRAFVDRVVFGAGGGQRGGLEAFFTAPYTVVDGALASYYGLPAPTAPDATGFGQVMRPAGRGLGVLAQGSILAERSQSQNSSPTKRGILVRHKLLCLGIPPQPAVVPDLPAMSPSWKTTRQRFEVAHAQGTCAGCHRMFDPIGFPFEHYDEGGRYRATENGEPIDASGSAIDDNGMLLFTVKDGLEELARTLAARPEVAACTAETLVKYLFAQDRDCLAADARNDFVDGKLGFFDLAASVAGAPAFSQRRD